MKFHDRFDIQVDYSDARQRFINRVDTLIFNKYTGFMSTFKNLFVYPQILGEVISALGYTYQGSGISKYVGNDFYKCLQALEALYFAIGIHSKDWKPALSLQIFRILHQ